MIVHIYIQDENNNITEVNVKGWTHEEFAEWVMNMYGEMRISHIEEKHYAVTVYTYNHADTEQIKQEIQQL